LKTVVLDASFAGAWIVPDESSAEATKLLRQILEGKAEMAVPTLWNYEICNLIRSALRRNRMNEADASEALDLMYRIPRHTFDHHDSLFRKRLMMLAVRFDLSAYDAAYLELADRLQCQLRTNDKQLRTSAKALGLDA
jgi:predicted nucleic acid-binding protein